jgi:hypothetical protein
MQTLKKRIEVLESPPGGHAKPLPLVVPDKITDAELAQLRKGWREVCRMSEFLDQCVVG